MSVPVSDRTDLRSPDVDARMDPPSNRTLFACPRASRLEVFFDPRGSVALVAAGRPLVYGTVDTRAVNRGCRPQGSLSAVPRGILNERVVATRLTCVVPRSARFAVRRIGIAERGVGSIVAVLLAHPRSIALSAVLEPGGSRLYYGRACRTR